MARFIVKKFAPGWYSAGGILRRSLGWGITEAVGVNRSRDENGVFVSRGMPVDEALRIAAIFESCGCEVDVEE